MEAKKKFPVWVIVLIVSGICALCVGVLVVAGLGYSFFKARPESAIIDPVESFEPVPSVQFVPTVLPIPTSTFEPETDPVGPALTGEQVYDGTYLFDDFSSDALGWPVANDETVNLQYENGQYSFQILKADDYDWAYPPIDFPATDIWFDVQGLSGEQNGTFGVFCQDQDVDNYYFVEFDLETRSYMVGEVINDESIYLTAENEEGNYWQDSVAFNSKPEQVNRIGVSCLLDNISLYINDQWVDDFSVPTPFETSGGMALFVYTFDFADEKGYKVYFDNVEIY